MKLKATHLILPLLFLMLCPWAKLKAQTSHCFQIESILVDACGSPEGANEMYRFQVGPNPIPVSDIVITWPNNPFRGWCLDQSKLDSLNNTIQSCGKLITPPGGILPAGKQILVITSTNMNTAFNAFTYLTDTLYVIFQCAGNTAGHFVNYGTTGPFPRTLIMTDSVTGCVDSVTYMKDSLTTPAGTHGAADGGSVSFDSAGHATYFNNGCNAPFVVSSVNAGTDSTYHICSSIPVISLHGTTVGNIKSVHWSGGLGIYSHQDSLITTYTLSPLDVSPIQFILVGRLACADSVRDTVLAIIVPPVGISQNKSVCQGSSYHIGTHFYTTPGTYVDTLTASGGCDSIVITHLTVVVPTTQTLSLSGCGQVIYKGVTHTSSTTVLDTLRNTTGCDSVHITVNIVIKNLTTHSQSLTLCQGQSITIAGHIHSTGGTYVDTLINANSGGCDSIVTTTLTVISPITQTISMQGCTQVIYKGVTYTSSTTVLDTLRSTLGCDSIRQTVNIVISNVLNVSQSPSICSGQSISVGIHSYNTAGTYKDTLLASGGCDSIVTTHLTVIIATSQALNLSGCGQVIYKGITHTSSTTVLDTLRSAGGCDSIHITVSITIKNNSVLTQNVTVCQGQSLTIGTHVHTLPGTYIDTIANAAGCDSIITTTLTNAGSGTSAGSNATICKGDSTQLHATGGTSYTWTPTTGLSNPNIANPYAKPTSTTTYTVTTPVTIGNQITNGNFSSGNTGFNSGYTYTSTPPGLPCGTYGILGCEGYYTVNTNPSNTHSQFANFGDHTTGTGQMMIVNGATSPSISVWCQNITVVPNTTYQFSAWVANVDNSPQPLPNLEFTIGGTAIGTYFSPVLTPGVWTEITATWNSGSNTTVNICLNDSSTAAGGNDFALDDIAFSQVCNGSSTVQVIVNPSYHDTVTATICSSNGPYTLPNGTTTNVSGTYTNTFTTIGGTCDSVIVTRLTVDTVINQTINVPSACTQVTYNGTTYSSDTTLSQTLHYQNGCDSIVRTVNIVVIQPAVFTQNPTVCQGQLVSVGTHSYANTGTYRDTIHGGAVSGCDSVIITNLTVIVPFTGFLNVSGTCSVTYQGQVYTSNALMHDTLRSTLGCDSLYLTVTIAVTPITPTTITKNVCINTGQSYFAGGQNQTSSGVYNDTLRTPGGCDSTYTVTDLNVISPVTASQRIDSCYQATVNGTVYTSSVVFADTVLSVLGCDSIFRTDSIVIHSPSITISSSQTLPIVEGDSTILTIVPAGAYQNIVWSPDSNISNINAPSPSVTPLQTTTYTVTATGGYNCLVSATIEVTVLPNSKYDFAMPTAFSPNGDGRNDTFGPVLRAGAEVQLFHIYNRWGQLVYDKDRDNSNGWNGQYKGNSQPTEVYTYFITVKGVAGNIISQQGNLTLIR